MAKNLREIRRKMKAIKSTRQVTKAMELVAASKMRKAVQNAVTLRKYAVMAWNILQRLAANKGMHPFLEHRPVGKVLAVMFTSDRGLCGSLNAQVIRTASQYIDGVTRLPDFQSLEFIAVGRKGQQFLMRNGQKVIAAFPAMSNNPKFKEVLPIARMCMQGYLDHTYDHVVLLYPDFISALVQEPTAKVLLPFSTVQLREMITDLLPKSKREAAEDDLGDGSDQRKYLFEPSAQEVLDTILPQLTEMQVYQAVLEAAASEHSARMVAMRNATDNANEILGDLTLTYNQTRQSIITNELAELSGARAALE